MNLQPASTRLCLNEAERADLIVRLKKLIEVRAASARYEERRPRPRRKVVAA